MITQREVSQLAYRNKKDDRVIEKDYVITWILLGVSDSKLKEALVFKGGTALKKVYFPNYRYSEDLDFTLLENVDKDTLIGNFRDILRGLEKSQAFVGPLQAKLDSRDIKVDFTLEEKLFCSLSEEPIKAPYSDSKDSKSQVKTYPLEEILVEKLCALIGRTEPRDLYDTHFLLGLGQLDYQSVAYFFPQKAEYKKIDPKKLTTILAEKESIFARLWQSRLAHQVDVLPPLDGTIRKTNKYLRLYKII